MKLKHTSKKSANRPFTGAPPHPARVKGMPYFWTTTKKAIPTFKRK